MKRAMREKRSIVLVEFIHQEPGIGVVLSKQRKLFKRIEEHRQMGFLHFERILDRNDALDFGARLYSASMSSFVKEKKSATSRINVGIYALRISAAFVRLRFSRLTSSPRASYFFRSVSIVLTCLFLLILNMYLDSSLHHVGVNHQTRLGHATYSLAMTR